MEQKSAVADFYADRHIFITGASGLVGKVLLEKLLRSCPKLGAVYILVRSKKDKHPNERFADIINSPLFDRLRSQSDGKKLLDKVHCFSGDILQTNLNLSNDDQKTLQDNVDMIFHMAANVRFDQALKPATLLNAGGTKNLLDLACSFTKLAALVHVSTAYCHCSEVELHEKLYKAPHDPRKVLDMVSWMDDECLKCLTPKLLQSSPNTYSYTKCLAEQLVAEYSSKLPLAIARPSVVTATWKEPMAGWIDNLNGLTGLIVGAGKGVLRTMHCDPSLEANIVPVDSVINSLILIGRKVAMSRKVDDVDVYHVTANNDNSISWGEALDIGRERFYENPFSVCLWYPGGSIKSNYLHHAIAALFFHWLPAFIVDFFMILTSNKPFLVRVQKRIKSGLEVIQYYTTRPWYFHNEKFAKLWDELSERDKKIFFTDQNKINFREYLLTYCLGVRKYCMHEDPETIPYARKVLRVLYVLDILKNILFGALFFWLFWAYGTMLFEWVERLLVLNDNSHKNSVLA